MVLRHRSWFEWFLIHSCIHADWNLIAKFSHGRTLFQWLTMVQKSDRIVTTPEWIVSLIHNTTKIEHARPICWHFFLTLFFSLSLPRTHKFSCYFIILHILVWKMCFCCRKSCAMFQHSIQNWIFEMYSFICEWLRKIATDCFGRKVIGEKMNESVRAVHIWNLEHRHISRRNILTRSAKLAHSQWDIWLIAM